MATPVMTAASVRNGLAVTAAAGRIQQFTEAGY
jgi:hypothetical protein